MFVYNIQNIVRLVKRFFKKNEKINEKRMKANGIKGVEKIYT